MRAGGIKIRCWIFMKNLKMIDTTLIDHLTVLANKEKKIKGYKRRLRIKGKVVDKGITINGNITLTIKKDEEEYKITVLKSHQERFALAKRLSDGESISVEGIPKFRMIICTRLKALEKGIVLAGGSAGSLAWFDNGTTDSRPKELSVVECLGFLPYSHSPHYHSEEYRRPLYHKNILNGIFKAGYAMDDYSGVIFKNGKPFKVVSTDPSKYNSYFVSVKDGKVVEEKLTAEQIE